MKKAMNIKIGLILLTALTAIHCGFSQDKNTKKVQSSSINYSNKVTTSFQPIHPASRN
jgi:ABC-type Zn uptake system ZnuABC Zn-binding protein ZnuA